MDVLTAEPSSREPPIQAAILAPEQAQMSAGEQDVEIRKGQERMKVAAGARDDRELERLGGVNGALGHGTPASALVTYGLPGHEQAEKQGHDQRSCGSQAPLSSVRDSSCLVCPAHLPGDRQSHKCTVTR